jgi:NADP-dependent alcohol dehydrogenase
MLNFEFQNPTKIIFGKGQIAKLAKEIPLNAKILMTYGHGSIFKNGVYDQVKAALINHQIVEFGGIEANPTYETLMKAVEVAKTEKIDFILAVGGGSVIDGSKFLSAAILFDGEPWDILTKQIRTTKGIPLGTVLTLPATGTEMNSGAVISRKSTQEKFGMGGPGLFPVFSILDPEVVQSIPQRQIRNGIIDAYTHVMEQYCTYPIGAGLQDRIAESILITLQEIAPKIMQNPSDYTAAADFMWCCTMALNGLIQKGVPTDWATHGIGHELTAFYGLDHAVTLSIIIPSLYTVQFEKKKEKLAQYGERVWGITTGSTVEKAKLAIQKMTEFLNSLGVSTKLSDHVEAGFEDTGSRIEERFTARNWKLGEHKDITPAVARKIVEMSY